MSLMDFKIRPKPDAVEINACLSNTHSNQPENINDYIKSFHTQAEVMERELGCSLPVMGHRVLLKAVRMPEKTKGGIFLTEQESLYDIGLVIGLGPEAYMDTARFPNGPRCKIGDWVDFTPFEKQVKKFNGYRCYILNDDRVNFPVPDISKVIKEYRGYTMEEIQSMQYIKD